MPLERGDLDVARPNLRNVGWGIHPTAADELCATLDRLTDTTNIAYPTISGTLLLAGGAVQRAGQRYRGIAFQLGTAVSSVTTNRWFCVVDQNLTVLAKTADQGAVETTANQLLALDFATAYQAAFTGGIYLGIVNVSTNLPDIRGVTGSFSVGTYIATPKIVGASTAGLVAPATLGATATAITGGNSLPVAFLTAPA